MNLRQRAKSTVRAVAHRLGYSIRKLDAARDADAVAPHVVPVAIGEVSFRFWVANARGERVYERTDWSHQPEPLALLSLARPGDRVLEIGCNQGFFTCLLARAVGETGSVVAIDANPDNALLTDAQAGLNQLGRTVEVLALAVSSGERSVKIEPTSNAQVVGATAAGGLEVPAKTIDELDRELGPFDLVKIDIEGYEGAALRAASSTMARLPRLALEVHDDQLARYGSSLEEVMASIHADRRVGTMLPREGATELVPFDLARFPRHGITNVFLSAR